MFIKTFRINKKLIIIFTIVILLASSICIFYSFAEEKEEKKKDNYIKWVDFNVSLEAMNLTAKLDIDSHNNNEEIKYNWVELLAYLACKNGGNFKNFKKTDLDNLVTKIKDGETMEDLTREFKVL